MNFGANTGFRDAASRDVMPRRDQRDFEHLASEPPGGDEVLSSRVTRTAALESAVLPRVPNRLDEAPTAPIDEAIYVLPRRPPLMAALVVLGLAAIPIGLLVDLRVGLNQGASNTPADPIVEATDPSKTTTTVGPTSSAGIVAPANDNEQDPSSSNVQLAVVETKATTPPPQHALAPQGQGRAAAPARTSGQKPVISAGTHGNVGRVAAAHVDRSNRQRVAEPLRGTPIGQVFLDSRGVLVDAQGRVIP
jgi:hypothetical protein